MNKYRYKVKDENGKSITGLLEAKDIDQAVLILRSKKLLIVGLNEEKDNEISELLRQFDRVKQNDLVNFTRQMSTMVAAGLPLTEALSILKTQSAPAMARVVTKVLQEVEAGSSLSDALEVSSNVFPRVYIALVRAGEAAGVLDEILKRLASSMEKQREFSSKTKGAFVYPVIVTIGMIAVGVIMMVFVVPKLTEMYKDFGADLPLPTKILMAVSDMFIKYGYVMLAVVGAGLYFFRKWAKTEVGNLLLEEFIFKIPIVGNLQKQMIFAEFTRTLGLMIGAGISILEALRIVADAMGSRLLGMKVLAVADKVEKGQPLAGTLAQVQEFPPIVAQMVAVGEQTGKVDEILEKLAIYFEGESETAVKALTTALEPLIMVVMGIGVGLLVMAVIMPIYNLTSKF